MLTFPRIVNFVPKGCFHVKTNERPNFAWNLAYLWLWLMTNLVWFVKIEGLENLPKAGPFILAPNHVTAMDPPLIAYYLYPRPVHYWTKVELMAVPVLGWVLKHLYVIPIKRGTPDRTAIRAAIQVLSDGNILGAFPEGSRHSEEVQRGSAFIARKAKAPIVPCHILWYGMSVQIRFGYPLEPGGTDDEMTAKLAAAIKALA